MRPIFDELEGTFKTLPALRTQGIKNDRPGQKVIHDQPTLFTSQIRDNQNRIFKVVVEQLGQHYHDFTVSKGEDEVANACCYVHGKDLELANIARIETLTHSLPKPFGFVEWTVNFQQLGIGTALLRFIINYARMNQFETLWGKIAPIDYDRSPWLPDWYRREGFTVEMDSPNSGTIMLKLSKS